MSATKHTPGPWVYQPHDRELIAPQVVVLEDDGACGDPECCGPASYWIAVKEEDAHLIAAAPDLLEALRMVRASSEWSCMEAETQQLVEAAIAKATGSAE